MLPWNREEKRTYFSIYILITKHSLILWTPCLLNENLLKKMKQKRKAFVFASINVYGAVVEIKIFQLLNRWSNTSSYQKLTMELMDTIKTVSHKHSKMHGNTKVIKTVHVKLHVRIPDILSKQEPQLLWLAVGRHVEGTQLATRVVWLSPLSLSKTCSNWCWRFPHHSPMLSPLEAPVCTLTKLFPCIYQ